MKLTGENRSTRGKICSRATLSTTNPTWTDPGSNPGLRDGRPAANRLSYGTAHIETLMSQVVSFFKVLVPELCIGVVLVFVFRPYPKFHHSLFN
jgi:hypothetical protein